MKKTFYKADKTADKMKNIQQMNRKTAEVEQKSGKKDSSNVEGKSKKPAYRLRVPKLRLAHRLFLYVLMLGFGALAICCTVFSFAPSAAEIVIYILAAILLFTGCFYLYFDLRYGIRRGMQEIIRPRIAADTYTSKVASDARLRTVVFAVPGARKGSSPLLMSIHRIGYVDSCVSILTLQTAMFAAFGNGEELLIRSMNGATGAGVSLIVLFLGIQGIVQVIGKKF